MSCRNCGHWHLSKQNQCYTWLDDIDNYCPCDKYEEQHSASCGCVECN